MCRMMWEAACSAAVMVQQCRRGAKGASVAVGNLAEVSKIRWGPPPKCLTPSPSFHSIGRWPVVSPLLRPGDLET